VLVARPRFIATLCPAECSAHPEKPSRYPRPLATCRSGDTGIRTSIAAAASPMKPQPTNRPEQIFSPWPHRLAWALACAVIAMIWVGGLVTTYHAGMSVPDWPTTYGYWFYPLPRWLHAFWTCFWSTATARWGRWWACWPSRKPGLCGAGTSGSGCGDWPWPPWRWCASRGRWAGCGSSTTRCFSPRSMPATRRCFSPCPRHWSR